MKLRRTDLTKVALPAAAVGTLLIFLMMNRRKMKEGFQTALPPHYTMMVTTTLETIYKNIIIPRIIDPTTNGTAFRQFMLIDYNVMLSFGSFELMYKSKDTTNVWRQLYSIKDKPTRISLLGKKLDSFDQVSTEVTPILKSASIPEPYIPIKTTGYSKVVPPRSIVDIVRIEGQTADGKTVFNMNISEQIVTITGLKVKSLQTTGDPAKGLDDVLDYSTNTIFYSYGVNALRTSNGAIVATFNSSGKLKTIGPYTVTYDSSGNRIRNNDIDPTKLIVDPTNTYILTYSVPKQYALAEIPTAFEKEYSTLTNYSKYSGQLELLDFEMETTDAAGVTSTVGVSETLYKDTLPVKVSNLKLNLDFTANVGTTEESRKTFEETLKKELATSLGITDPNRITITDLSPGSVNVTFTIQPSTSADDPTAQQLADRLNTMIKDPNSELYKTAVLSKVDPATQITVTKQPAPGLSPWLIALIVIASLVAVGLLIYFIMMRNSAAQTSAVPAAAPTYSSMGGRRRR